MAFYAFTQERVEAAIIEVGIGGKYDFTNILYNRRNRCSKSWNN